MMLRLCRAAAFELLLVVAAVLDRIDARDAAGRVRECAGRVG